MRRLLLLLAVAAPLALTAQESCDFTRPFPLIPDEGNSLMAKWAAKPILDSALIDDMEGSRKWSVIDGIAEIEYTSDLKVDGKRSLRYHTSLLDEGHIKSERSKWDSLIGWQGGENTVALEFDEPQDWSGFNRLSLWVYVHPSKNPNVHLALSIVNEGTSDKTLTPGRETSLDIPQGIWYNILWEIDYYPRDRIKRFEINQTLIGYDREMGERYVTMDFDRLQLQRVEPDHFEGWDIPEGGVAYSHVGYRPNARKVAVASGNGPESFSLIDSNGSTVFSGGTGIVSNKGHVFSTLDFSGFTRPGEYRIKYGNTLTPVFPIRERVWYESMFNVLNFYFCQRCGFEVPGIHGVCHQDNLGLHEDEYRVINGGWHDAADLSQGFWRTAMGCYSLMRASDAARKGGEELSVLASRLDEEASWGLEWLLKTSFKDGYHIEWNTQRIYSDNKIGTLDDVVTKATFNPWENYLGAAVMLTATDHLQEFKDGKDKLVSTAMDLWDSSISKDNGLNVILEASWGAIASVRLYSLLGDEKYRNAALRFGEILTDCQETSFVDGIPITGYFYTSPDRRKLVHYYHAAFHEAPVIALRELCDAFPEEDQWSRWIAALAIHSECYLKRGASISAPYNLLPAGIYRKSDIPADIDGRENYYKTQYEAGTPLGENHAMRAFPIWEDHIFHGSTTCDLSNAWALAEASVILGDKEGLDIVQEQLEWLLGRNPFNQSLVYGVGHDYAPLFEYCTSNVTGAIPVGIDSFNDDTPFWNGTACATSKEMWIETANRFMGTVATMVGSEAAEQPVRVSVATEDSLATATLSGKGRHTLEVRTFNAECGLKKTEVRLRRGKDVSLTFNLKATDKNKPYVAALILDGDTSHPIVITGY